jgi:hypothetical protein
MGIYQFLNYFFFIFHTSFTLFNIFGWIFKKTRIAHLVTILLTAFSWFFLGIWYGPGYCFCTDWHWKVREKLGYADFSNSYIHFLVYKLTGINFNETMVINVTMAVFFVCLALSLALNAKDIYIQIKKKKNK